MANKGNAKSGNKQAQTNPATPSSTLASSQALQEATDRINLLQENLLIAKDNLKDQREKNKTLEEAIIIHAEKLEDAEVKLEDAEVKLADFKDNLADAKDKLEKAENAVKKAADLNVTQAAEIKRINDERQVAFEEHSEEMKNLQAQIAFAKRAAQDELAEEMKKRDEEYEQLCSWKSSHSLKIMGATVGTIIVIAGTAYLVKRFLLSGSAEEVEDGNLVAETTDGNVELELVSNY